MMVFKNLPGTLNLKSKGFGVEGELGLAPKKRLYIYCYRKLMRKVSKDLPGVCNLKSKISKGETSVQKR